MNKVQFSILLQLVCSLLLLQVNSAFAIVNVEQAITGNHKEGIKTNIDWLVSGASGNTDKSSSRFNLASKWKHGEQADHLQLQYLYGQSRGQTDTDRAFMHLRHRTAINPLWGVEGFTQVGNDVFARLTLRTLLGGGMRRVLFEDADSSGYLGAGVFHEREVISQKTGTTDPAETSLWRANSYLLLKLQLKALRIYNATYYQPAVDDTADYRILEQSSLLMNLEKNLDLKLTLEITYDSKPAQTVQQRDVYYGSGLQYNF